MLDYREFGKNLGIVHLQHSLEIISSGKSQKVKIHALLILPHPAFTPEMSNKIGLCSQNGPVFTSLINPTAAKYILILRSRSTMFFFAISAGLGEFDSAPSMGMFSPACIGGQNCAEPNIYGTKE